MNDQRQQSKFCYIDYKESLQKIVKSIKEQILQIRMLDQILKSSTPDGLAPMSLPTLTIFTLVFAGLAIIWGVFNFLQLLRIGPQQQDGVIIGNQQTEQVREMGYKILMGSLHYMKFNSIVVLGATVVYFLIILGAIQKWSQTGISISYLLGMVVALLCSFYIVITAAYSYFRIVYSAKYSASDAFVAAKTASTSITFLCTGLTLASIMALIIKYDPTDKTDIDQINHRANTLLSFAFGFITVATCTKITSLIYSRGIENSFEWSSMFDMKGLKNDSKHPMVICKGIGETVNKSLSKSLDYLAFISSIIAIVMKAAGMNIIGVDQKGQIVFDLSSDNAFAPLLLIGFSVFFSILLSLWKGSAQNEREVKRHFRINSIGITVLLSGFTALACYLTLPAEFQIAHLVDEDDKTVKSPLYAYLPVLVGMFVSILISLSAEIKSSGLKYIYDLMKSCKTGAATCLISGLSKGYFYTFWPMVAIAPFGFLCYFWLGNLGVGSGLVGFAMFIPYYMNVNLYHSIMNCASMISYVSKAVQNSSSVESLLSLNQSKKSFEHKIIVYYNQVACLLAYTVIAVFAQHSKEQFSIGEPHLFSGMLAGAMSPYIFSALLIRASYGVAPVICYDVQQQVEQNPGATKGKVQLDYHRSNHVFTLNCAMKIIQFLPLLILPNIITGVAVSIQSVLGFMGGLVISAVQLSVGSSMSGTLWGNVKDQIAYGRAKDEHNQEIAADSEWGRAAEVGNTVGCGLKESLGQSGYILVLWTIIMASVFEDLFISIHSD